MVQFAKRLLAARHDPWQDYYLDYKRLKKTLKHNKIGRLEGAKQDNDNFRVSLDEQVEKVVLFFLEIQGKFASQLSSLKQQQHVLLQNNNTNNTNNEINNNNNNNMKEEEDKNKESKDRQDALSRDVEALKDQYDEVGHDLVKFVYFCELNTTGLRKILKKHDKQNPEDKNLSNLYLLDYNNYNHSHNHNSNRNNGMNNNDTDSHLQQLFHYGGISALVATIRSALKQLRKIEHQHNYINNNVPMILYGSTIVTDGVKVPDVREESDGNSSDESSFADDYEPILEKIDAARRRLRQSTQYVQAIAAQAMIFTNSSLASEEEEALFDEMTESFSPGRGKSSQKQKEDRLSSFLNLTSTFLYMTNYYIIAPTCGAYAEKLSSTQAMSGIIIGMTPVAALVSSVLYSWWANHSYKSALLFSSVCSLLGNLVYALALSCDSLEMVLLGRLLNGFGGARAINRRYIADTCRIEDRTAASAAFVTAGALGMAAGPAIASLTGILLHNESTEALVWTVETAPGWIMFAIWAIQLFATYFCFQEPPRPKYNTPKIELELPEAKPLLSNNGKEDAFVQDDVDAALHLASMENGKSNKKQKKKPKKNRPPLYKNVAVMSTLAIYFVQKLVLECLLSSTSLVTTYYFSWHNSVTGLFLAMLGLLMFPANMALAQLSHYYSDRKIIMFNLVWLFFGTVGICNFSSGGGDDNNDGIDHKKEGYTPLQFITFGICIFVSANVLEGVNMSLLSKTLPKHLAKGTFNSGFLATEAGTLGRAVGDMIISVAGMAGIEHILNYTFRPLVILVLVTTITIHKLYHHLTASSS